MNTIRKQKGLSFLGFLSVAALVGVVALLIMKLFPLYNESFKVYSGMKAVTGMSGVATMGTREIRKFLLRNYEVADVDRFNDHNIKDYVKITRTADKKGRIMTMKYQSQAPLIGNLSVIMDFDKSIPVAGTGP